jgi:hypothetical protein
MQATVIINASRHRGNKTSILKSNDIQDKNHFLFILFPKNNTIQDFPNLNIGNPI